MEGFESCACKGQECLVIGTIWILKGGFADIEVCNVVTYTLMFSGFSMLCV